MHWGRDGLELASRASALCGGGRWLLTSSSGFLCSKQIHISSKHKVLWFVSIAITFASGVATSRDGLRWERGSSDIAGARGAAKDADVGRVMAPNADWWWHDTRHMAVSDVQARPHASPVPQMSATAWLAAPHTATRLCT